MSAAVYSTGADSDLPVALHLVVTADGDRIVAAGTNPVSWTSLRLLTPVPVTRVIPGGDGW